MNLHSLYLSAAMVFTAFIISSPPSRLVTVIIQKDKSRILSDSKVIETTAARVLKEENPKLGRHVTEEERRLMLTIQAEAVRATPDEIDRAIREWGRNARGPFRQGLAALYERN